MSTAMVVVIIVAVVAILFAAWMFIQKQKSEKLRTRFGPEYDRLVASEGDRRRAEATLEKRATRMEKIHIRALKNDEVNRFGTAWREVQVQFVDDPRTAVSRADKLVQDVMNARGYPMGDFEQRAADISVDHAAVVDNYRAAHDVAVRDRNNQSNTEELRQAMVHYRALFEDLLGVPTTQHDKVEVHS